MKLNFVCIGAQKAGTTTLHDILKDHPDIYLPETKEAHFFDVNERFKEGLGYFFQNFYASYSGEKVVGNINPNLQVENRSIDRLVENFGNELKFIFILRDPVKRAYSHYLMSKRRCFEDESFIEAVTKESFRISNPRKHFDYESNEPGHFEKNHLGYISRSIYSTTLIHLRDKVPNQNIHIVFFEDLVKDTKSEVNRILKFLSLKESELLNFEAKSNPATGLKNKRLEIIISKPSKIKYHLKQVRFLGVIARPILAFLRKKNVTQISSEEKSISEKDAAQVYSHFFKKEIDILEILLNKNLDHWRYSS